MHFPFKACLGLHIVILKIEGFLWNMRDRIIGLKWHDKASVQANGEMSLDDMYGFR